MIDPISGSWFLIFMELGLYPRALDIGIQEWLSEPHYGPQVLFLKKINLFIYYLFLAALGLRCCVWLSLVVASRGYSSLRCVGFSLWWLLLLRSMGSRRTAQASGMWVNEPQLIPALGLGASPADREWNRNEFCPPSPIQFTYFWAK